MDERTTFILGLVCCTMNLAGWIITLMAEKDRKQFRLGIALLTIPMFILAGMVIAERW